MKTARIELDKDQFGGTNGRQLVDAESGKILSRHVLVAPLVRDAQKMGYLLKKDKNVVDIVQECFSCLFYQGGICKKDGEPTIQDDDCKGWVLR